MRKVVSFTHMSLDGYVSAPNGEFDWITYNDELANDAGQLSRSAGAALYGRVTYKGMESYWPTVLNNPDATDHERQHAAWIENIHKVVFSRTLESVSWNNTTLIKDNVAEEVNQLKQQPGGDMLIFGSPGLTHSLARLGLIDEYRINLNPISLGSGTPLFEVSQPATKLRLTESRTLGCGVVALRYAVER
jgi:dihydrofolate reductase